MMTSVFYRVLCMRVLCATFALAVLLATLTGGAERVAQADETFVATQQIAEDFDLSDGTVAPRDAKAFRKRIFGGLSDSTQELGKLARDDAPDPTAVREELQTIVLYAREVVQAFHPNTASLPKRRALPAIWQRPDEFVAAAIALERVALEELAADPAELSASLQRIGATCSGCHRSFRARR